MKEVFHFGEKGRVVLASLAFLLPSVSAAAPPKIGGIPVGEILSQLGAKMEKGVDAEQLTDYARHFDLVDLDGDGSHSKVEYIEKGKYMTPQARRGIFAAADNDGDGLVTRSEYTLNRIITDEGKAIMQAMDDNKDGAIEAGEFTRHAGVKLKDKEIAKEVFSAFDSDGDGKTRVPEYLRVWGKWARAGHKSPAERLAVRESDLGKSKPIKKPSTQNAKRPQGGRPSVEQVFQRFDTNGDGKLSKSEIPEFVSDFILPADADKDGAVSKLELKKHRESKVTPAAEKKDKSTR